MVAMSRGAYMGHTGYSKSPTTRIQQEQYKQGNAMVAMSRGALPGWTVCGWQRPRTDAGVRRNWDKPENVVDNAMMPAKDQQQMLESSTFDKRTTRVD